MAESCGEVTIEEAFDSSDVVVDSCAVPSGDVTEGDSFDVEVTVANGNTRGATATVEFEVGPETETTNVDVSAEDKSTASVSFDADAVGTGTHRVNAEVVDVDEVTSGSQPRAYSVLANCSTCESVRASAAMTLRGRARLG